MATRKSSQFKGGSKGTDILGGGVVGGIKPPKPAPVPEKPDTRIYPEDMTRRGVLTVPGKPAKYSTFVSSSTSIKTNDLFHADYDKGYEARHSQKAGLSSESVLDNRHNGVLSFDGANFGVPLFVSDVMIDFSVNGSTHQSASGAVYYPRNFTQTSIAINCQAPTQLYYGKVLEAIRDSQMPYARVSKLVVRHPKLRNSVINGIWEDLDCDGYVSLAQRKHERHNFSPNFQITFTVVKFTTPKAWADDGVDYQMQDDWHKMITPNKKDKTPMVFEKAPKIAVDAREQMLRARKAVNAGKKAVSEADVEAQAEAQAASEKNR